MKTRLEKKQQKVVNGMNNSTQKKFKTLLTTLEKGVSLQDLKQVYDVKEMWVNNYKGKNQFRVKFDYRFRTIIQLLDNGMVQFVNVLPREGYLK